MSILSYTFNLFNEEIFRKSKVNLISRVMIMNKIIERLQPCSDLHQIGPHKKTCELNDTHHLGYGSSDGVTLTRRAG